MKCHPNCPEGSHSSNTEVCTCRCHHPEASTYPAQCHNPQKQCGRCFLPHFKPSTEKCCDIYWHIVDTEGNVVCKCPCHSPEKKEEPRAGWESMPEYHVIEKILTDFKNGETYSESIEKLSRLITQAREEERMDAAKRMTTMSEMWSERVALREREAREEERTKIREMVEGIRGFYVYKDVDGKQEQLECITKRSVLTALQAGDNK